MAGLAKSGLMTRLRRIAPALALLCLPLFAQPGVPVRRASPRTEIASYLPASLLGLLSIPQAPHIIGINRNQATVLDLGSQRGLAAVMGVVMLLLLYIWPRERRLRGQRERIRKIYHLGEQILGS